MRKKCYYGIEITGDNATYNISPYIKHMKSHKKPTGACKIIYQYKNTAETGTAVCVSKQAVNANIVTLWFNNKRAAEKILHELTSENGEDTKDFIFDLLDYDDLNVYTYETTDMFGNPVVYSTNIPNIL